MLGPQPAAQVALASLAIEPGPISDVASWEALSVAHTVPLLSGARVRALDFVFSLGGDALGSPVLRLLPAEPDEEKRALRVLVTQETAGAVAGSLVHYEIGDLWVCELQPTPSTSDDSAGLSADGMETLAGALSAAVKPMRAALTASATLGCVTEVTPVFIRPNSAVSRALLCGAGGIGSEAHALRDAAEGRSFLSELTPAQVKAALIADGADELFAPGPWDISSDSKKQMSALLERRESQTILAACPELRMGLLSAAALSPRCETLRSELGGAAELPAPLGAGVASLQRNDAVTSELCNLADEMDANSVGAICAYLQEQRAYVQGKIQVGQMPNGAQIAGFFTKMGSRLGDALPTLHPEIVSSLTNTFQLAGWDIFSNCSVATVPPNIETVIMMLDMLVMNISPFVTAPQTSTLADSAAKSKYDAAELTHAIILDTTKRGHELATIVAKRLTYCAQLAGGGLPEEVVCDTIFLHGTAQGAVIHWKETPESAMLTAAMLERLRGQLPMAVNNFDSVGYIFSAGAADAALAAGAPFSAFKLELEANLYSDWWLT